MDDSTLCIIMLTHFISYNPSPHIMVPFVLVPLKLQEKGQERERERGQTAIKKSKSQREN